MHAIFAFYFLDDTYYNGDYGPEGERSCVSLLHCFFTTLNYGPRHDPAIGHAIVDVTYADKGRYYARMFYDLSFKCVVKICILNIIFGIIIDTFASKFFFIVN